MESVASAGLAMEQMVEDFGLPIQIGPNPWAVYCPCCRMAVYDWGDYQDHRGGRRHRERSAVIQRRRERRRQRRAALAAALLEADS